MESDLFSLSTLIYRSTLMCDVGSALYSRRERRERVCVKCVCVCGQCDLFETRLSLLARLELRPPLGHARVHGCVRARNERGTYIYIYIYMYIHIYIYIYMCVCVCTPFYIYTQYTPPHPHCVMRDFMAAYGLGMREVHTYVYIYICV